jgi:hypothetical protein
MVEVDALFMMVNFQSEGLTCGLIYDLKIDRSPLYEFTWNKLISLKVSFYFFVLLRLLRDRLSTKDNLASREKISRVIYRVSGYRLLESSQHLFVECKFFVMFGI